MLCHPLLCYRSFRCQTRPSLPFSASIPRCPSLSYEPGDVAKVCCQNTGDGGKAVLRLCDRLQLKPQQRIDIETLKEPLADNAPKGVATQKVHFRAATVYPSQCTIEELVRHPCHRSLAPLTHATLKLLPHPPLSPLYGSPP